MDTSFCIIRVNPHIITTVRILMGSHRARIPRPRNLDSNLKGLSSGPMSVFLQTIQKTANLLRKDE